eukprot:COSAG02_NODE_1192_length_13974_cov_16.770378_8_plen_72_part_00
MAISIGVAFSLQIGSSTTKTTVWSMGAVECVTEGSENAEEISENAGKKYGPVYCPGGDLLHSTLSRDLNVL